MPPPSSVLAAAPPPTTSPPIPGVPRKGGMEGWHDRLAERFATLRAARDDAPLFCLEHGLDEDKRRALLSAVGGEVRRRGISDWWKDRYLPLLVAATETGYAYMGTGTDFWPKFSESIGARVARSEKETLSRLFERGHLQVGLRKPVLTPWTKARRHIAWPIVNAVAPMEIHRPLANALREVYLFGNRGADADETAFVETLRTIARRGWSNRFEEWLADGDLAAAVVLRLLRLPDPRNRVSSEALDRVLEDLRSDREARQAVDRAVALRERTAPKAPSIGRFSLRLARQQDGDLALSVCAPPIHPDLRARLVRAFGQLGTPLMLWDQIGPVVPEHFLSGYPVPLDLKSAPGPITPFLVGILEDTAEAQVLKRLSGCEPDLKPPIVFQVIGDGSVAEQHQGALLPTSTYLILTGQRPAAAVQGVRRVGEVMGLQCLEVNARVLAARSWLEQNRFQLAGGLSVDIVGGLPLGEGPNGPVFGAGFPILLYPRFGAATAWPVTVRAAARNMTVELDAETPFAMVDAEPGDYQFVFEASGQKDAVVFQVAEAEAPEDLLTVTAEPAAPNVEDLLRSNAIFRVLSPLPVEDVQVRASLTVSGTELFAARARLARLPAVMGPGFPLMDALVSALRDSNVHRDAVVELRLDVADSWRGHWRLGRELLPCVWENQDGRTAPYSDGNPLDVIAVSAVSPLAAPVDISSEKDNYFLLLPELDGQPLWSAGLCVGPKTHSWQMPSPELPRRLLRQPQSSGDALGLLPCLEAYGAWASASSTHMLAEYARRTVVEVLERATVEQLCGPSWSVAEEENEALPGDRWSAFVAVCMDDGLAYGDGFPELPPQSSPRLAARLQAQFRAAVPELWTADVNGIGIDDLAATLDEAVLDAWSDLHRTLVGEGRAAFDEDDVDPGSAPERWAKVVGATRERHELTRLAGLVLPRRRADVLRIPDYATLAPADVIALLEARHVDVLGRQRHLTRDDLALAFRLWVDPRGFIAASGWREVAGKLLVDRQTARAVRYAALRFRASRALTNVFRGADV